MSVYVYRLAHEALGPLPFENPLKRGAKQGSGVSGNFLSGVYVYIHIVVIFHIRYFVWFQAVLFYSYFTMDHPLQFIRFVPYLKQFLAAPMGHCIRRFRCLSRVISLLSLSVARCFYGN